MGDYHYIVFVLTDAGLSTDIPSPTRGPFVVNATHDGMDIFPFTSDSIFVSELSDIPYATREYAYDGVKEMCERLC